MATRGRQIIGKVGIPDLIIGKVGIPDLIIGKVGIPDLIIGKVGIPDFIQIILHPEFGPTFRRI
jgi:hypothetical protein